MLTNGCRLTVKGTSALSMKTEYKNVRMCALDKTDLLLSCINVGSRFALRACLWLLSVLFCLLASLLTCLTQEQKQTEKLICPFLPFSAIKPDTDWTVRVCVCVCEGVRVCDCFSLSSLTSHTPRSAPSPSGHKQHQVPTPEHSLPRFLRERGGHQTVEGSVGPRARDPRPRLKD
jgi:hypothetical protein